MQKNNKFVLNWKLVSEYRTELMGLASILIMIFHSTMIRADGNLFCNSLYNDYGMVSRVLFHIVNQLNIGVEFFLFVSGVGLYYSYEKKPKFKDFYTKRIINVYAVCAIITLTVNLCQMPFTKITFNSLVLNTFSLTWFVKNNNTNWYVSFIMIMYLIFPLIYRFVKVIENKKYAKLIVALIIAVYMVFMCLIGKTVFFERFEIGLTRVPIFFAGAFSGYFVKNNKPITIEAYLMVFVAIALKTIKTVYPSLNISNRLTMFFVFYPMLIVFLYLFKILPTGILKFFRFFGEMSLELYLVHGIVFSVFGAYFNDYCNVFTYILTMIIALPISLAFSKLRKLINKKYNQYNKKQLEKL